MRVQRKSADTLQFGATSEGAGRVLTHQALTTAVGVPNALINVCGKTKKNRWI